MIQTTLRNAELTTLATLLKSQSEVRHDVVAHSDNLRFEEGNMIIRDQEQAVITFDGVTTKEVCLEPTDIFDSGISQRLEIPRTYVRKMRDQDVPLLDTNVNAWLARSNRQWFLRGFLGEGEECGMGRAFLSDRYGCIDNYDVLLAALKGVHDAGVQAEVVAADLSESRMRVKVAVPAVRTLAPTLLKNYNSPFAGEGEQNRAGWNLERGRAAAQREGLDFGDEGEPVVFAGFIISNSETGGGAFTITPSLTVKVCKNGLTITKDALRRVHLGGRMEEGLIKWSEDTTRKQVELVTAQAGDAARTFCDIDYITKVISEVEEAAGVEVAKPTEVITQVCKTLKFTDDEAEGILGHFITGGQMTAGGVLNAVTSFAQTVPDPDRGAEIEDAGIPALEAAAKFATV